jgi:hypothetical protein
MAPPKDPSNVNKYHREVISPDELPPDYMGLLSLLAGLIALFLKSKLASWAAAFLFINSIATAKSDAFDYKNAFMAFIFCVFSLAINYFGPQTQQVSA